MRIFQNLQRLVEKRTDLYINNCSREEEKANIEHMVTVGSMLSENKAEIEAYMSYKFPERHKETTASNPASDK